MFNDTPCGDGITELGEAAGVVSGGNGVWSAKVDRPGPGTCCEGTAEQASFALRAIVPADAFGRSDEAASVLRTASSSDTVWSMREWGQLAEGAEYADAKQERSDVEWRLSWRG